MMTGVPADQIAEIRPAIVEVFDGAAEGGDWCATFVVHGFDKLWVQVTRDMLNFAYPHDDAPADRLQALTTVPRIEVVSWDAGRFATISYPSDSLPREVAAMVDEIFRCVLDVGDPGYPIDVSIEKLD